MDASCELGALHLRGQVGQADGWPASGFGVLFLRWVVLGL